MKKYILFSILLFILFLTGILLSSPLQGPKISVTIDSLVVLKSKRQMYAYSKNKCIKIYDIALGRQAVGKKHFEGDLKTPEGLYSIHDKNPNSRYHKNLGVSYPNQQDLNYAQKNKLPAGGDIKIHGLRNYFGWIGPWHRTMDWTLGCIALTNEEVDELFQYINIGTPILIQP